MTTTGHWTLMTNHGACLRLLARSNSMTVREIAEALEITERSAARVLSDLRADGYLEVQRQGRRNRYVVNFDAPLRHKSGRGYCVRDLFAGFLAVRERDAAASLVAEAE